MSSKNPPRKSAQLLSVADVSNLTIAKRSSLSLSPRDAKRNAKRRPSVIIAGLLGTLDADSKARAKSSYLHGRSLQNIPQLDVGIVRIFISSTFSDMQLERNTLMIHVYPRMKAYCRQQHGLEFQIVDMRWGVTETVTDNHLATDACMQEIKECQQRSVGPNFLILVGQRYGWIPLQWMIEKREFEQICIYLERLPDMKNDLKLLKEWYLEDTNSVPSYYILQRITKLLPNYSNVHCDGNAAMEEARAQWSDQYARMQKALSTAVNALCKGGVLPEERQQAYSISVTHMEVNAGLLEVKNAENHCLAFVRTLTAMPKNDIFAIAPFVDTSGFRVDSRFQDVLNGLRECIIEELPPRNQKSYEVAFADYVRMQPFSLTNIAYLQSLVDDVSNKIATLVARSAASKTPVKDELQNEVIQHLRQSCENSKDMSTSGNVLHAIKNYVMDNCESPPLIVCGQAGCGRTTLLATLHAAILKDYETRKESKENFAFDFEHVHVVVRFIGSTSDSSSLVTLLKSVCSQLTKLGFQFEQYFEPVPAKQTELCEYFYRLVSAIPKTEKVIILFDSLENLDRESNAKLSLQWLPNTLQPNVKIVLTTDDGLDADEKRASASWFQRLVKQRASSQSVIQVGEMDKTDAVEMFNQGLTKLNRKLTAKQQVTAEACFNDGALPLYVKLLTKLVEQWRSYDDESLKLPPSIGGCINELVMKLESSFGNVFVSHALSYLTATKVGLSEMELEDILSLDEQVLNEIYQWHIPPIRRLPALMLTRLVQSLSSYLAKRQSGTTTVLQLHHSSIRDAIQLRYLRNEETRRNVYSLIAHYFLGTWAGKMKPYKYSSVQLSRFNLEDREYESDRLVCQQPFIFTSSDETSRGVHYNQRKIVELPFSLIRANMLPQVLHECFFNFQFLYSRMVTSSVESLIADIEEYPDYENEPSLLVLLSSLKLSASKLHVNPSMLGCHLLARLLPYYNGSCGYLRNLLQQCDTHGSKECALVPVHHCMQTPGGPLQHSFEASSVTNYGVCIAQGSDHLFSANNKLCIWSLDSGTMYQECKFAFNGVIQVLRLSPDSKLFAGFTSSNQVILCTVATFQVVEPPAIQQFLQPITATGDRVLDVELTNADLFVWTSKAYCRYSLLNGKLKVMDVSPRITDSIIVRVFDARLSESSDTEDAELVVAGTLVKHVNRFIVGQYVGNAWQTKFECFGVCNFNKTHDTLYYCESADSFHVQIRKLHSGVSRVLRNREPIFALVVSDNDQFVVASMQHSFLLWNLNESVADPFVFALPNSSDMLNFPLPLTATRQALIVFSHSYAYMACAVKRYILVYSLTNMVMTATLDGHYDRVVSLSCNPNDDTFVSSSMDHSIKIWDFKFITAQQHALSRLSRSVEFLHVSQSGFALAITKVELTMWNTNSGRLVKSLSENGRGAYQRAVLSNSLEYLITVQERAVTVWSLVSWTQKWSVECEANSVLRVRLLDDDRVLLLKLAEGQVKNHSSGTANGNGYGNGNGVRNLQNMAINSLRQQKFVIDCVMLENNNHVYKIEYEHYSRFGLLDPCVTDDESFLCLLCAESRHNAGEEVLGVFSAATGTHTYNLPLRYPSKKEITFMCKINAAPKLVALCDCEKAAVFNVQSKLHLLTVQNWQGLSSSDGRFGLSVSADQGLFTIDLKTGKTLATIVDKYGMTNALRVFIRLLHRDEYVLFYDGETKFLKVFRLLDNVLIAKVHFTTVITCLEVIEQKIVLGFQDGTVMTLLLVDPKKPDMMAALRKLPSRRPHNQTLGLSISLATAVRKLINMRRATRTEYSAPE